MERSVTSSCLRPDGILLGDLEGLGEPDHVFARAERVEGFTFLLEVFHRVVRGLDRETDAALGLVDLDDAGLDFLADLEGVLDLLHVIFADLRDVDEAVDLVSELHEGAEVGEFSRSCL